MKSNKCFTLVEILAVVVVLGIIVLISTNIVLKQLDKSRKQAFITDVQQYIKSTSYDSLVKDRLDEYVVYSFPNSGIEILPSVNHSGFMIKDENDNVRIQVWHSGLNACAVKSFTDKEVTIDESLETEEDCNAFLSNITSSEIAVKSLTGEDVDYKIQSSCYTLDGTGKIANYNTSSCGDILVIPNKINGTNVTGIADNFVSNATKDFTSFYLIGVKNITETPANLLSDNHELKKIVISLLPNLTTLKGYLGRLDSSLDTFYLSDCPKLTTTASEISGISGTYGVLYQNNSSLANLTLENLPKLESLQASFTGTAAKKINISNFDSLTTISDNSFSSTDGDTEVTISGNQNLETISSGALSSSNLKSMNIFKNTKLTSINNAIKSTSGSNHYIDELFIYDNPNLETIEGSSFEFYEFDKIKLYNMPKLKNIRSGAFSNIKAEVVDLSGLELETFDFSSFSGASIEKIILPSTIASFTNGTAASFDSIINASIEFGGSNKCSLINLFRTSNGNGTYTYLVDQSKLPSCP